MATFVEPTSGLPLYGHNATPRYKMKDISTKMVGEGIYINHGALYNSHTVDRNAIRMGFASMNAAEMESVIMALRRVG